jgi:hypothetical protein
MSLKIPARVQVAEIISSRYAGNEKPLSWDSRVDGVDVIRATSGELLKLQSDGGQSPPKIGWDLMLTDKKGDHYTWTLYGLPRENSIHN